VSFLVHLDTGEVEPMGDLRFAEAGLKERQDLQRWVTAYPELAGPNMVLITTEFDRWAIREQKVSDRLDALLLDSDGSPVIAELKRDRASDTVELQALKYAAYCAQLTLDDLVEMFAVFHEVEPALARQQLIEHAPSLEDGGPKEVKIRLIAGSFGPAVTSVVLWLSEHDIDIGCVEVRLRQVPGSQQAVLSTRQLLPLPEAADYLVRRARKEREEDRARQEPPADWTWDMYAEFLSPERVKIARLLFEQMTDYVERHQLQWQSVLRNAYFGYKRSGGYYVFVVQLHTGKPIEFGVKLPREPENLGVANPYPNLRSAWYSYSRQWMWEIPSVAEIPDLSRAMDIARDLQPITGAMPRSLEDETSTHDAVNGEDAAH